MLLAQAAGCQSV